MSAIAGMYNLNKEPMSLDHINSLMGALQKYPADDIQIWNKVNIFLGCHAQWITPESVREQLPYYDYERQVVITADAIIDNREELFDKLQVERSKRKEMPDSQLILLAYYKWGEESPKYLVGDFAFMIWNEKKQELFGARDFSGSRTLYYYFNQQRFVFCTTMEPLFSLPYIVEKLNEQWLAEYLAIPGMNDSVDALITVQKNIQQIPPAHSISVIGNKVNLSRYVTLTAKEEIRFKSNNDYVEAFRDIFQTAVTDRLRTHLKVGAHLSGGLDSGSVASFASRALKKENKQLYTYSYVPANDFMDWTPNNRLANESPFIKSTVDYAGNIKDHYLDSNNISPLSEIDDWLIIMEMPYKFYATSVWIKGIFEKSSDHGIGVLLNGGRGNLSISWGSALNYYALLLKKLKWVQLFNELNYYSKNIGGNRLRLIPVIGKFAFPLINRVIATEKPYQFPLLINPEFAKKTGVFKRLKQHGINASGSFVSGIFQENIYEARKSHFQELFSWNTTGTVGTKLSLYHSLWKRDPTNDIRLIKFCLSLPEEQYVQNGLDRALVRRSTKNILPDNVRLNQRVRGIQGADAVHRMAPFWDEFLNELEKITQDPILMELLNIEVIKKAMSKVKKGPKPELSIDPEYSILIRSIILSRFIKKT